MISRRYTRSIGDFGFVTTHGMVCVYIRPVEHDGIVYEMLIVFKKKWTKFQKQKRHDVQERKINIHVERGRIKTAVARGPVVMENRARVYYKNVIIIDIFVCLAVSIKVVLNVREIQSVQIER